MIVKVLRKEGASCVDGFIAKPGTLTLTREEIRFDFRATGPELDPICIDLQDVDDVDYFKTLSIIPNGLTLFIRNGDMIHFVVDDRRSWQESIVKARNKHKAGS